MSNAAPGNTSSTPVPPAAALEAAARHRKLLSGIIVATVALQTARNRLREELLNEAHFTEAEENARDEVADAAAHVNDAIEGLEAAQARAESLLGIQVSR
jgi:hypothetical protein